MERRRRIRKRCEEGATDRSLGLIAPFCGLAVGNMMQTETQQLLPMETHHLLYQ